MKKVMSFMNKNRYLDENFSYVKMRPILQGYRWWYFLFYFDYNQPFSLESYSRPAKGPGFVMLYLFKYPETYKVPLFWPDDEPLVTVTLNQVTTFNPSICD